jgi:excisionase family DNA binding protein
MQNLTEGLTLETLPKAFSQLANEVSEIKRLLVEKSNKQPAETERWFNLAELCEYLPDKPAKATVYAWVHHRSIPCHKGGRRLRFLKSEINNWLNQGKKTTVSEYEAEMEDFLGSSKNKGRGNYHGK